MLTIYRRHSPTCPHKSRDNNRCRCRIWYDWSLDGHRIIKPIGTRDWQRAQQLAREMEATGQSLGKKVLMVETACDNFLEDAKARGLRESSLYKYRLLFKRLKEFCKSNGIVFLNSLDVDKVAKFRETWTNKGTAARKKLEALRTFFTFCHDRGWITTNPAKKLGMPKNEEPPVEPFTRDEMDRILAAVDKYPDKANAVRLKGLVLLLRYSGLRLGDAVTLDRSRIDADGRLFLRTAKTKTKVFVPLPSVVIEALDACPDKRHPFWSGESKIKSVTGNWQRALQRLFELAKVPTGHAHRFRHTFATELLTSGATIANVAQLLGHSSSKITERHYNAWVKGRQDALEADVRKAWGETFARKTVTTALQSRRRVVEIHKKP
jgi:integrase/recombinase XerD